MHTTGVRAALGQLTCWGSLCALLAPLSYALCTLSFLCHPPPAQVLSVLAPLHRHLPRSWLSRLCDRLHSAMQQAVQQNREWGVILPELSTVLSLTSRWGLDANRTQFTVLHTRHTQPA